MSWWTPCVTAAMYTATAPWVWWFHRSTWTASGQVASALWAGHFARRAFEALFVARYNRVESLTNVIGGSVYYWGLSALIGWSTSKLDFDIGRLATAGVAVFAIGEIGNFYYHYYMSNLRSSGKKGNFLPKGGMFNYVVAPHYFFELLTWLGWNMVLGFKDIPSAVFWFASLLTMGLRAKQKHASYVEQFDGKDGRPLFNKNTKFIIPFLW